MCVWIERLAGPDLCQTDEDNLREDLTMGHLIRTHTNTHAAFATKYNKEHDIRTEYNLHLHRRPTVISGFSHFIFITRKKQIHIFQVRQFTLPIEEILTFMRDFQTCTIILIKNNTLTDDIIVLTEAVNVKRRPWLFSRHYAGYFTGVLPARIWTVSLSIIYCRAKTYFVTLRHSNTTILYIYF